MFDFFKLYRIDRLLFYYIPFFIGTFKNNLTLIEHSIFFCSFFLIFELMIILNDYTDKKCDKYNNRNRLDILFRKKEIILYLILFIIYSLSFEFIFFNLTKVYYFGLIGSIFLSLLYHCKPIRLKRFFPLNNIILGINASFLYLWGSNGNYELKYFVIIGIYFSIASIYKDFKDITGDLKDNVFTLPSLLKYHNLNIQYGYVFVAFLLFVFNSVVIYIYHYKIDLFYFILYFINICIFFTKNEKVIFSLLVINSLIIYIIVKN